MDGTELSRNAGKVSLRDGTDSCPETSVRTSLRMGPIVVPKRQ